MELSKNIKTGVRERYIEREEMGAVEESNQEEEGGRSLQLGHLYMTVFLYNFATYMVIPAITDVTMEALCPALHHCSLAIYLTGFQQTLIGLGTMFMMPLMGNLSDYYGRKALLIIPMALTVLPFAILAYNQTNRFFYAYYVFKTLTAMLCEGSVHCLALAYAADHVAEHKRASVFGIITGMGSCAFVCGNLSTRFLSTPSTFQVAASVGVLATMYMKIFLSESVIVDNTNSLNCNLLQDSSSKNKNFSQGLPSPGDMLSLLKSSKVFSQLAFVAFVNNLGDVGLHTSLLYYLKACFDFDKDEFANLMVIVGIAGSVSQLVLMPLLVPLVGEEKLLSVALFFNCAHMLLYSTAWSSWVPYCAALLSCFIVFSHPCLRSITSKQVGPNEQGKAQGCISGINSLANVMSPLVFSPLTALFLSKDSPFQFPGFSIMLAGFVVLIAFAQSLMIRSIGGELCGDRCTIVIVE